MFVKFVYLDMGRTATKPDKVNIKITGIRYLIM